MVTQPAPARGSLLFLPVDIAGFVSRLREPLVRLGWDVRCLDTTTNPFDYPERPPDSRLLRRIASLSRSMHRRGLVRGLPQRLVLVPLRLAAALRVVPGHDVLVYVYGASLSWGLDVRIARRRGRRIVTVYLGSDSRPPYLDGNYVNRAGRTPWLLMLVRSWQSARRVRFMQRMSDVVICNPASAQFLRGSFTNWHAIGMPVPVDPGPPQGLEPSSREGLIVLHAPSHPRVKGTARIAEAVAALERDGHEVRLLLLSGVPNALVRSQIEGADLVVDQLYSDTPLAGLASEAASAGRPVVTFGYVSGDPVLGLDGLGVPHRHFLPPEQFEEVLRRAVGDRQWLADTARGVSEYVRSSAAPEAVAARLDLVLRDEAPPHWSVAAGDVRYMWGCGVPKDHLRGVLQGYIARFGPRALFLPDGSRVEEEILREASAAPAGPGHRDRRGRWVDVA